MNRKLFAGSRTKFTCACKQLLDYCTKVLLSFWCSICYIKGDVTRDDSQRPFLAQHNVAVPGTRKLNHTPFKELTIKNSVNILGVYFKYDRRLRRKLNFHEITKTIKDKLRIWKWRDLTIIGRIQLIKTFIIPTFLYRASFICMDKEFVNDVNKIIFDFIWKTKDKVKHHVLVGDIEDGGLKAPHLDLYY